jgi:hypothetical protein
VHIGAIVSLAEEGQKDEPSFSYRMSRNGHGFLAGPSRARLEILGRTLLERTVSRLRLLPSVAIRIIPESASSNSLVPARSAKSNVFVTAWEDAVERHVREGADQLLLLRISSYSDLDYEDLLRFHTDRRSALTQAYGALGALDVAVVDTDCLRGTEAPYRKTLSACIAEQERFLYEGYVNPLKQAQHLRTLVEDALAGRCGLQPIGNESSPGVWIGNGAQVDPSVAIESPVFIGAGSRIAEGCSITGSSSIERDCEIDCGTNIDQSSILQSVYVGVALNLHRSVVSRNKLFHLDHAVEVEIDDERLLGATRTASLSRAAPFGRGQLSN